MQRGRCAGSVGYKWTTKATESELSRYGQAGAEVVYRKSKSVWEAVGDYMGEQIKVKDRSEGAVLMLWRNVATYKAIR